MPVAFKDSLDSLLMRASVYMNFDGLDLIRRAYEFTVESNRRFEFLRFSGEPAIVHPLSVADTLVRWRLDPTTVAAGILHDIIEDPNIHSVQLRATFGDRVTQMVDGVSKLKKFEIPESLDADTAYYYKIFLAVAQDTRVALIKIADRMHNLRTLDALPGYKQLKNAYETQQIFIPLSRFLGLEAVAEEMEEIAFQYSKPEEYAKTVEFMERIEDDENELLEGAAETIGNSLAELGVECRARVFRYDLFHTYKLLDQNEPPMPKTGLVEVTVPAEPDCYIAMHGVHRTFQSLSVGFQDTIHFPSIDLKRMIETSVLNHYGRPFITRIVSREMKTINRWGVVPYLAAPHELKKTGFLADRVELIQRIVSEFRERAGDHDERTLVKIMTAAMLKRQVSIYTTGGRRLELPESSTALDFAYQVGPETGNHFKTAAVNGVEVGMDYCPNRLDRITFLTDPESAPRPEWLEFVRTPEAQMHIKKQLAALPREKAIEEGSAALVESARDAGIITSDRTEDFERLLAPVAEYLLMNDIDDFFAGVGRGEITVGMAMQFLREQYRRSVMIDAGELEPLIKGLPIYRTPLPPDSVETERPLKVDLYPCEICSPLPGDDIFVVSSGRKGIAHRNECGLKPGRAFLRGRRTTASWLDVTGFEFPARIKIKFFPSKTIHQQINRVLEIVGATVVSSQTITAGADGLELIEFVIKARNTHHAKSVCDELLKLKDVIVATRI
jgi:GTP diphosphokinase / guanosine-3',5'-bis(diphosphate) 3'-diphosphatase